MPRDDRMAELHKMAKSDKIAPACGFADLIPQYRDANASLERAERSDDTLEDLVRCENCGGSGVISFNPNLNPNNFPDAATAKCTRCGGTGIEDTANNRHEVFRESSSE